MDERAVETVQTVLAETSWLSVPCPPEYLPALARDVLYALEKAGMAVGQPDRLQPVHVDPEDLWDAGQCVLDWRASDNCDDTPEYRKRLLALAKRLRDASNAVAVAASREEQ